ncbi:MAG: endosialidase [Lachnospiraceae bacterium]|nr:endosialidase [Lachnospiraceae bacterium]
MAVVSELIRSEADGTISFGDYTLGSKSKLDNFEHGGDLFKVKTFREITKLEKNGMFVYESVPGTAVAHMTATEAGVEFQVEGPEDAEITLGLQEEADYKIEVDGNNVGEMKTNLGGKLTLSVELNEGTPVSVKVVKLS